MQTLFENTPREAPLFYFEQLAAIPRESGNERGVSDFILNWCRGLGLEVHQDEIFNLIVKKPASTGYEDRAPVILQAHLDMVCEKDQNSDFNFETDAIPLMIDGEWLKSSAGTTLGADDGIGVALIMAVLADDSLKHPPLEVIFTVQEETTFLGAESIDWSLLEGTRLINIDNCVEQQILCGSCGGTGIRFTIPLVRTPKADGVRLRLFLTGLAGGHSGEDIHRGRGSAFELMNRLLLTCKAHGASLIQINGGSARVAIPREAEMDVWLPAEALEPLSATLDAQMQELKQEYEAAAPALRLSLDSEIITDSVQVMDAASLQKIIGALLFLPNGIQEMNAAFADIVASSCNLGMLETTDEHLIITAEARGAYSSAIGYMQEKCVILADFLGADCEFFDTYVPWKYNAQSTLRDTAIQVYEQVTALDMTSVVVHAGIECGIFLDARPELDAISIGPDASGFHSPREQLNIPSTLREWSFLIQLLERL